MAVNLVLAGCANNTSKKVSDDETTEDTRPHKTRKPAVDEESLVSDETETGWTDAQLTKAAIVLEKALDTEDANDNYQPNSKEDVKKVFDFVVNKTESMMTYAEFQTMVSYAEAHEKMEDAPAAMKKNGKQVEKFFEACGKKYNLEK